MLLCLRRMVARLLRGQPLPSHVAFIMDGNRRFADQLNLKRIDGHSQGYGQMKQILQWCLELGISCISVYAFSIDNFRRPQDEVDALMQLAELKFEELMNDADAKRWGAELRVIGDLSRAPASVQAMAARLMKSSKEQGPTRAVINICFSYTSSQELQHAVDQVCCGMQQSELLPEDITPELLQRVMHTQDCPPVDLVIRTSGEQRLSDFLLWQSSHALLHWEPCLWPEFGYARLLRALQAWQQAAPHLEILQAAAAEAVANDVERVAELAGCHSGACSPPPCPWTGSGQAAVTAVQQQQQQSSDPAVELQEQLQQKLLHYEEQQQQPQSPPAPVLPQGQQQQPGFQQQQQQQQQQKKKHVWWGGLFSTESGGWGTSSNTTSNTSSSSSNGSSSYWSSSQQQQQQQLQQQQQQLQQSPAGRSPDRASSMSLSAISEEAAICCPHPSQQLRVDQYLRRLAEEYARHLQVLAA